MISNKHVIVRVSNLIDNNIQTKIRILITDSFGSERPHFQTIQNNDKISTDFHITFDELIEAQTFIQEFYKNLRTTKIQFERKDIEMISDIESISDVISREEHCYTMYEIELLDKIITDMANNQIEIVKRQKSIIQRLSVMEDYFAKSGVIYYQQFTQELLKHLSDAGILDFEEVSSKMFITTH